MLYFAYGSNMDPVQMAQRCPQSPSVGIGHLPHHELCFPRLSIERGCGVASVRPKTDQTAWGVIYDMNPDDLLVLDTYEAHTPGRAAHLNGYNRAMIDVVMDDKPVEMLIYIAVEQEDPPLPNLAYLTHLRDGARHFSLPKDYISFLDSLPYA